MIWEIICLVGEKDSYKPENDEIDQRLFLSIDRPGEKHSINYNAKFLFQQAGVLPSTLALDLLYLAIFVYSADRCIPRKKAYNRWERWLKLDLPVSNQVFWVSLQSKVESLLRFLTNDHWEIRFRQAETIPSKEPHQDQLFGLNASLQAVALLSGGLDSFIGAIDLLERSNSSIAFVSHYNQGSVTHKIQRQVYSLLDKQYPNRFRAFQLFVQPPKNLTGETELSSRSRSFLFLSLGAAIASIFEGMTPLYITENGFMSLNVPLAPDRIGSLSTRTTHPYFLNQFQELIRALKIEATVENPYMFFTKGEMLEKVKHIAAMQKGIKLTVSCSNSVKQRFQSFSPYSHCGYCLPCLIRRAASHKAGVEDVEYNVDVLKSPQGIDLQALKVAFRRMDTPGWSPVFEVMKVGSLTSSISEHADVYKRGMLELKQLLCPS